MLMALGRHPCKLLRIAIEFRSSSRLLMNLSRSSFYERLREAFVQELNAFSQCILKDMGTVPPLPNYPH